MLPDYYKVLGVLPTAALGEIKEAFRYQATRHHPDRGGSHERMVAINEAWGILSNQAKRAEYDAARQAAAPPASVVVAEQNTYQAREEAQHYPEQWAEFETWMDSLIRDFQKGEEGTSWHWFKFTGFAAGFGLVIVLRTAYGWQGWGAANYLIVVGCGVVGMALHAATGWVLENAAGASPRQPSPGIGKPRPPQPSGRGRSVPPPFPRQAQSSAQPPVPPSQIIACPACGQNLRVPCVSTDITVTCRTCKHLFPWQAAGTDRPFNP